MAKHMFAHNDKIHWDINFIRLVNDWEVEYVSSLSNALYSVRRSRRVEDKWC